MSQQSTQKEQEAANRAAETEEQPVTEQAPELDEVSKDEKVTISEAADESELDQSEEIRESQARDQEAAPEAKAEDETLESVKAEFEKKLAEKEDRFMRLAAEFENFKKRSTQEMRIRIKYASQPLALNIISGLDNLERALDQAKDEENEQLKEFVRGVEMVQQQLYEALKQNNIERVYPIGEPFDPNKHEAMSVIETDEVEPDHIVEVFQAGYFLHDRAIRPAMVQVAKKK